MPLKSALMEENEFLTFSKKVNKTAFDSCMDKSYSDFMAIVK